MNQVLFLHFVVDVVNTKQFETYNEIIITIIISLSLNLYMSHFYQHSNLIVYSWNWDHNISEGKANQ